MGLSSTLSRLFKGRTNSSQQSQKSNSPDYNIQQWEYILFADRTKKFMTSQFPALYLKENNTMYRFLYVKRLNDIGITRKSAEVLFDFECDIVKKFDKDYLLHSEFTKMWFFELKQPFFQQYPQEKEDILKERFFTMSELCKMIDEAEWHFWNSHERNLSNEVFAEIYNWRLKGEGMSFAAKYFDMIVEVTGISEEDINKLCAEQGRHLCKYKW